MSGSYPAAAQSNRAIVYPRNPQLLEAFDASNDIDERIDRPDLMQGHPIGG